jgi:hypothetical protein
MATIVTGDRYFELEGKLGEIRRQLRQERGYPFSLDQLDRALQAIVEGRFEAVGSGDYFTPILDSDLPEKHKATGAKYRREATDQGKPVAYPICYRVRASFTLKLHAPLAGPCYKKFQYLQDWDFAPEATEDGYVFWIPGVLQGSTSKSVSQQRQFLVETRTRLGLPAHHMSSFGRVALVAGLILAHFKITGERISLVMRTDTCDADGDRLCLDWNEGELSCGYWYGDDGPYDFVGVPALGVELGS